MPSRRSLASLTRVACVVILACSYSHAQKSGEPLDPAWCGNLPRPAYKKLEVVESADPWFEVYRIRPGVFAIYEPHQFEEVISYLIVGSRRALLFDTGLGVGKISVVVAKLTGLPVTVINSHTHFDHVGGNAEFTDIWNQDLAYTRRNARGKVNRYSRDAVARDRICGKLPEGMTSGRYSTRAWKTTGVLKDDQRFDLGERELEVIFTPGHTPDSLCLLDRKNGLLFTGDTFYPGPIYLFVPETDFSAYGRSVSRIASLVPALNLLLPSHNIPVADPANLARLQAAVQSINAGSAKPRLHDGQREYVFDGFSILLADK